jgi:predicted transcriptional regulator
VESVRLEPQLRDALVERARRDDETPSSVIRKALRKYLNIV